MWFFGMVDGDCNAPAFNADPAGSRLHLPFGDTCPVRPDKKGRCVMSSQFVEAVEFLLRFFADRLNSVNRFDFKSGSYRTRLPDRQVGCVAKCLDRAGDFFQADALRQAYKRFREAFFAESGALDSITLTKAEEERLAAMTDEDHSLTMEFLTGSEEQLRRDLGEAIGSMARCLEDIKRLHGNPSVVPEDPSTKPANMLTSWRDILVAMGLKYNNEDKSKVSGVNKTYDGPIIIPGQGRRPLVEKTKLLLWWNGLEKQAQEIADRKRDSQATVSSCHNFGRTGEANPEIGGGVKRRRGDRKT